MPDNEDEDEKGEEAKLMEKVGQQESEAGRMGKAGEES